MCIELTCKKTDKCVLVVKGNVEAVFHEEDGVGSGVKLVSGATVCVKQTVKEVHDLLHQEAAV